MFDENEISGNMEQVAEVPENNLRGLNEDYLEALNNPPIEEEAEDFEEGEEGEEGENMEQAAEAPKPKQSPEENAAFAKIRREAEARAEMRAKDQMIAELYGKTHGIYTYADYQRAVAEAQREQEAEEMGIDPQFYNEFQTMKEKVTQYEREKTFMQQDNFLSNDPVKGELYREWREDVRAVAQNYNVDLATGFTLLLDQRLGDILGKTTQKVQSETIKKINQNARTSTGSLSQAGETPSGNAWEMNDNDFNKLVERAKRGELRR